MLREIRGINSVKDGTGEQSESENTSSKKSKTLRYFLLLVLVHRFRCKFF